MGRFTTALATFALVSSALAANILKTDGFSTCGNSTSSDIKVNNVDISFDRSTNKITFDVSGYSGKSQEVTAELVVTAYGKEIYSKSFDPCDDATKVDQLCPVPAGSFSASGDQEVPSSYASMIPAIAFSVPDLDGSAQMILKAKDSGEELACIKTGVSNGKSVEVPAVSVVAAAIAAAALVASLISGAMSGSKAGSSTTSPGFCEVMWWFQGLAMNGMHSVNYPAIYRSFTKNFAFSTGLIPWADVQESIDSFRSKTGGNLTNASYKYLQNATLVYPDGTTAETTTGIAKRSLSLFVRDISTSINGTSANSTESSQVSHYVNGIQGYVERLSIPETNTFMTVLLVFAIVIAAIAVGILLFKVILEAWALFGTFPKSLTTFRKEYWRVLAQTITSLVLLLYGVWTLYCIFQFTHGDSWAAKALAGITLGIFTAILAFYTWKIFHVANKFKKLEGSNEALFENKETWKKYKLFYENYRRSYWWLFIPAIVYMFAKGCVLASADGHGLVQTAGQLIIESLMLILLLWSRPYERKSGNWINIIIQVVRVLSVVCILVFVEELGIAQTTKTVTGIVLVVVQSALTGILAILILVNSIITCCKQNPHRKRRKAAQKHMSRDLEGDAFLMAPHPYENTPPRHSKHMSTSTLGYEPMRENTNTSYDKFGSPYGAAESRENLVSNAARMSTNKSGYTTVSQDFHDRDAGSRGASPSPPPVGRFNNRKSQPSLPNLDFGGSLKR